MKDFETLNSLNFNSDISSFQCSGTIPPSICETVCVCVCVCVYVSIFTEYLDLQKYKKKFKLQMPRLTSNRNFYTVLHVHTL